MSRFAVRLDPEEAGALVERIRAGDATAWARLVDGYLGLLTASLRGQYLNESDVRDVIQTTWLRLVQNLDRIEDPQRVGGWLMTTARREAFRVTSRHWHELTLEPESMDRADERVATSDHQVLAEERDVAVRTLLGRLPPRCRQLLGELFEEPRRDYGQISESMNMPVGSIGPTRARCLEKIRTLAAEAGVDLHELARA